MSDTELQAVEARIGTIMGQANGDLEQLRALYDDLCDIAPLPVEIGVEAGEIGGVACERLIPPGAEASSAILYLHGGGFMVGSLRSHRGLAARLAVAAGRTLIALDFRLAPEAPYPAALDDAMAAYRALLGQGLDPRHLTLAGDSAGGGLCLSLMLRAREEGLPLPGAAVLFSPFVDMTGSADSLTDNAERDALVTSQSVHGTLANYAPSEDGTHPWLSALFGDLGGLPPLLIHVGSSECLLDDSLRLARKAALGDTPVELKIWPRMPHVWQIFAPMLAAGQASLTEAGAFVKRHQT